MSNEKTHKEAAGEPLAMQAPLIERKRKAIIGGLAAVIVIVAAVIIYNTYVAAPREIEANTLIAKAQDKFAAEQFETALNGDSTGMAGFSAIASDYSGTKAGNLANLYAGLCCANLDRWEEAVQYLEKFSSKSDQMISPAAEAALGNAYAHLNQLDKAVEHLKKAAKKADNNSLSPTFLIQAGEILESQGKKDEALTLYKQVKEKYVNSLQYQTIDKYIERASAH